MLFGITDLSAREETPRYKPDPTEEDSLEEKEFLKFLESHNHERRYLFLCCAALYLEIKGHVTIKTKEYRWLYGMKYNLSGYNQARDIEKAKSEGCIIHAGNTAWRLTEKGRQAVTGKLV